MFKYRIEVAAILLFFVFSFSASVTTNLLLYRTCYVILGYNKSECALLGTDNESSQIIELEKLVQPYENKISMVQNIILSLITNILCFFIGSWIDKHGRKPSLLAGLLGFTINSLVMLIISLLPNASPWWVLLSLIPLILTGGFPSFMTVMLCYVSDGSSESDRGLSIGIFEGIMAVGGIIGSLSSSYAFKAGGYVLIYSVSLLCNLTAFLYVLIFLPEIIQPIDDELNRQQSLFDFSLIKDTFKSFIKRRENNDRLVLMLLTLVVMMSYLGGYSSYNLMFLYVREKFDWSLRNFNYLSCFTTVLAVSGSTLGIYLFHKVLRMSEQVLMLLGIFSMICSTIIIGAAQKDWLLYLASTVGFLGACVSPMTRSLVTKIANEGDLGKVFAVISALETFMSLIGSFLYSFIYNATLNFYSGFYNFVTAGFLLVAMISTLKIITVKRNDEVRYREIETET